MTKEEQKKLIEGYIVGLCAGKRYCFDVYEEVHQQEDGTLVVPMDCNTNTVLDVDIRSLLTHMEELVQGERLPYTVGWRLEVLITPTNEEGGNHE